MVMTALAIGSTAATIGGMASSAGQSKKYKNQAEQRGEVSYGDYAEQYGLGYDRVKQDAEDAAMQNAMRVAGSGGSAGSQAAARNQAQLMAPQMSTQASLAAAESGMGYAQGAGAYNSNLGNQQSNDYQNLTEQAGNRAGAAGGMITTLGGTDMQKAGMLSDKRAKVAEDRVDELEKEKEAFRSASYNGPGREPIRSTEIAPRPASDAGLQPYTPRFTRDDPYRAGGDAGVSQRRQVGGDAAIRPPATGPGGVEIGNAPGQLPAAIAAQANDPMSYGEMQSNQERQANELLRDTRQDDAEFASWARSQGVEVGAPTTPAAARVATSSGAGGSQTPQGAVREETMKELAQPPAPQVVAATPPYAPAAATPTPVSSYVSPGIPGFASNADRIAARDAGIKGDDNRRPQYGGGMAGDTQRLRDRQEAEAHEKEIARIQRRNWIQNVYQPSTEKSGLESLSGTKTGYTNTFDDGDDQSDERSKVIEPGTENKASAIFAETPGSNFQYKEEFQELDGADEGSHYGIMAQDLEKTPEGATMVNEGEDGLKRVDTDRLSMANSAAINEILERLRKAEGGSNGRG